jgi:hypothetical protein
MKTGRPFPGKSSSIPVSLIIIMIALLVLFAVLFAGCSDSTAPGTSDDNGDTPIPDWPVIPQPSAPYEDTEPTSDTLTVIQPLATNYRPTIVRALCPWSGNSRFCTYSHYSFYCEETEYGPICLINLGECWTNDIYNYDCYNQCAMICSLPNYGCPSEPIHIYFPEPYGRILLMEKGDFIDPVPPITISGTVWTGNEHWCTESECTIGTTHYLEMNLSGEIRPIQNDIYVRRDRYWHRVWIADENSYFKVLIGDTEYDFSVSFTAGTSTTETETFGRSVTKSAGLDFGALKAGVEVTISQSFSTSVTISEEMTVEETYKVFGEDGKYVQFQVWEGVEIFTITDAEGNHYTDPKYAFEPDVLYIHGNGPALVATKFDYP